MNSDNGLLFKAPLDSQGFGDAVRGLAAAAKKADDAVAGMLAKLASVGASVPAPGSRLRFGEPSDN